MGKGKYVEWVTDEGLGKIRSWAEKGLTHSDISKNIGITERTFYEWLARFPQMRQVLKVGKDSADEIVENALYNSAVGFHYAEEYLTPSGQVVELMKYSKPNTTAQIFWLKNRQEQWSDKQDLNHSGGGITIVTNEDEMRRVLDERNRES